VFYPVATLKVAVAVAVVVVATRITLIDLNDNHQLNFEETTTALNCKAASSIVAPTNKLILLSQL
jgi:hypothetical protein